MTEIERSPEEYLFVYGTLRQGVAHPLAEQLSRQADYIGPAFTRGKLFLVDNYPGMVDSDDPSELVCGDLFRLLLGTTLLQQLDNYEECAPDHPELSEYLRRQAPVTTEQGADYTAWLYLYNGPTGQLARIPSGDYFSARGKPEENSA